MNELAEILNQARMWMAGAARPLPPEQPKMTKKQAQDLYNKRVHEATLYFKSKYPRAQPPEYSMREVVPEYYR